MFAIDERLKGLPALRDQVVSLYQSLNQPHLAVPGKQAGPAQGYVLGLRSPSGFAVFVYLHLPESQDCAVYAPSNRAVTSEKFAEEETDALGFVESMGFIMDNLNFRGRPNDEQEQMMKTLAVFQRDPKSVVTVRSATAVSAPAKPGAAAPKPPANAALGKLFGSFCLTALLLTACKHVPTPKEQEAARIHYDLAVQVQQNDPQSALREYDAALETDPNMAEAWHGRGILLHVVFGRPDEAVTHYKKALELKPDFSEAKANLGNVYLDQKRFDEAIAMYEAALNDMLYASPYIAHGNMGWAKYMKGDTKGALSHIKSAVLTNPKFCLGYKNLGIIYDETGDSAEACKQFTKYREKCNEVADAWTREGTCFAKIGQKELAKKAFTGCQEKATDAAKDECKRLQELLGP
jgi:Tfp pilus assembly protein PilF